MTPKRFREIGEMMFGPTWKTDMAGALGNSPRTIHRWAVGTTTPIPDGASKDVALLCRTRGDKLLEIANELEGK